MLEQGDIEEGLNAASAIGDDRLQKQSRGYVAPESFTHGSSEQRVRWFKRGFEIAATVQNMRYVRCETFSCSVSIAMITYAPHYEGEARCPSKRSQVSSSLQRRLRNSRLRAAARN